MLRAAEGRPVCVAVTHLDGLVLAHSAFHHSANYRSVTIFGTANAVEGDENRAGQLRAMVERLFPGRWDRLRPLRPSELAATRILAIDLSEASAKIRSGPPDEDPDDLSWPVWAGVLPIATVAAEPVADEATRRAATVPAVSDNLPFPRLSTKGRPSC